MNIVECKLSENQSTLKFPQNILKPVLQIHPNLLNSIKYPTCVQLFPYIFKLFIL